MSKEKCDKNRAEYFNLMGFNKGDYHDLECDADSACKSKDIIKSKHEKAFEKAHEIRKFEINLYWERNKYMYVIVGAVFLGAYKVQNVEGATTMSLFLSFVGMVVAFAWVLINKGSKFWLENWESHIDMLEDEITGDLYKVVDIKDIKKNAWSVSKVNIHLSIFIFYCFSFLFIYHFFHIISLYKFKEIFHGFTEIDYLRGNWKNCLLFVFGLIACIVWLLFVFNVWFNLPKQSRWCITTLEALRSEVPIGKEYYTQTDCDHIFSKRNRNYAKNEKD